MNRFDQLVAYIRTKLRPRVPGIAAELVEGERYHVTIVVNLRVEHATLEGASQFIASSFRVWGADVHGEPAVVSDAEAAKFLAGEDSVWDFQMTWTRPEKFIPWAPPWLSGTTFVHVNQGETPS